MFNDGCIAKNPENLKIVGPCKQACTDMGTAPVPSPQQPRGPLSSPLLPIPQRSQSLSLSLSSPLIQMCFVSLVHAQQYPEIRSPVPIHTESHFMGPSHWVLFIGASFCSLRSCPAFSALWTSNLRNKVLSRTGLDNVIPLILLLPRSTWWDHVILHSHVPPSLCTLPEFRDLLPAHSISCPVHITGKTTGNMFSSCPAQMMP